MTNKELDAFQNDLVKVCLKFNVPLMCWVIADMEGLGHSNAHLNADVISGISVDDINKLSRKVVDDFDNWTNNLLKPFERN